MTTRPSNIIKIGEAAELLGMHPNTIRRWEAEGKIKPAVRFQGKGTRYYDKESLVAMMQGHEIKTFMTIAELEKELDVDLSHVGWAMPEPYYSRAEVEAKLDQIHEYNQSLVEE